MKITLILSMIFLSGCAGSSLPEFPSTVKTHYMIDVRDEVFSDVVLQSIVNLNEIPESNLIARCLKFKIVSTYPYKISFQGEVPLSSCNQVGGYTPTDMKSILNWLEEVADWAADRKKMF